MAEQRFSAAQREAIWLAYEQKCAYTSEPLDISNFHIDHIIPESLIRNHNEYIKTKERLKLSDDFDPSGFENLAPIKPGINLQKGSLLFDETRINYFLAIAAQKKNKILDNLNRIERRRDRGRALILLQRCLEGGDITPSDVADILDKHGDQPFEIFKLIEGMKFSNAEEIRSIKKSDIADLRNRPIRFGANSHIDGVTLTNQNDEKVYVRSCAEYESAINSGYFAYSNFDNKMSIYFRHQCGLLKALESATTPKISYISEPRVGVLDLNLMPYGLFPYLTEPHVDASTATYEDKVRDGSLILKGVTQNKLVIQEPEGIGQMLIEVARADFNNDGIEDILLYEYGYATHGTLGFGGVTILTRRSAESPFEALLQTIEKQ